LVPVSVERTPVPITGGYTLGRPPRSELKLYDPSYPCFDDPEATCYPTVVDEAVVSIGWDSNYIIVERHPRDKVLLATPDSSAASWFIISISTGKTYADLSWEEFTDLRQQLDLSEIQINNAMDKYHNGR
jgi:hypothetical protein